MLFHPSRFVVLCAAILLSACASSRSLDQSFSDISGNAELKAVLFTDRSHDYSDIDITLYEGRLMLTGTMRSEEGRRQLIANAWKAENVKTVIDEIIIAEKTSFGQGFEDSRIDQTLRARLIADNDVSSGDYKMSVSRAVVYLLGGARNQGELDEAVKLARSVNGVEKVVSHVVVRDLTK
ncbi:BON domain-containing protein [Hyphococcus flavus]|uniref:BON domain-containing protein n=1 Tax=Hyphococcus flavus TaxID=1866326 RepID=A0AAF0CH03_9PROT|nr:BON domain-containing protein [Hyphococcus flavus]WDI32878.1 BON domain-containing protein [Hyphococcus flavus]